MQSNHETIKEIFDCTQCGECCKGYGGTFLTEEDIDNISEFLDISPQEFIADYCQQSGGKPLLAVGESGYCIFWDKICTIHNIKPRMCRKWPYIESVLKDLSNWQAMASCCPGMQADASERQIKEAVLRHLNKTK